MSRLKRIDQVYQALLQLPPNQSATAHELAELLGLSRANVSNDLNQLWKEGKVSKSNGRPVRFSPLQDAGRSAAAETVFDKLAVSNKSLRTSIEQAKAAILYPPNGMHTLILGESGVGKSTFAGMMHTFAVETKKGKGEIPFITFNCADYANNPQLLLAQLFGVKKGAYTGAEADREGLIQKANGGILFLDEVHRLPAEGQEMFFTFMDKGVYRRLGETEERTATVQIISATTENPESALLRTFMRRIPMVIKLPSLRERGLKERFNLITQFFREESYRVKKEIHVSANAMRAFLLYHCPNNIGQLRTDIQLACAKAYADYISNHKEQLEIYSCELAEYVKAGMLQAKEYRQSLEELIGSHQPYFVFRPDQEKNWFEKESVPDSNSLYENIEKMVRDLRERGVSDEALELDIENYFSEYLRGMNRQIKKIDLSMILQPEVVSLVEGMIEFAQTRLQKVLSKKVLHSFALHVQTLLDRVRRGKQIINPQLNQVRTKYKKEFEVALDCVKMIEDAFQVDLPIDEAGFLTMFFILQDMDADEDSDLVQVLVIMHGRGCASSMVEVTNRLLEVNHAQAIDLPLEAEPQEALAKAKEIAKQASKKAGMLLLADMGSLLTFGEIIEKDLQIPVKVIPLVSTLHVIEATRKAMLGLSLQEIYQDVRQVALFDIVENQANQTNPQSPKAIILTACMTGEGSALAIKNMLQHHLRYDEQFVEIVPLNIVGQEDMKVRLRKWKKEHRILCMVSSFTIDKEIPTFSIEDVLNLRAIPDIQKQIDVAETYHRMGEVLTTHVKHTSGEELVTDVRKSLELLQDTLAMRIPEEALIGLCLHLCCMVDRLMKHEVTVKYPANEKREAIQPAMVQQIKNSMKPLEQKYQIAITEDELAFLLNFFAESETLPY